MRALSESKRIDTARRWPARPGRGWGTTRSVVGTRVLLEAARREESGTIVAVQSPMLASEKFSTAFFAHGGRTERAIGFVCRHFGKEAFEEKKY